MYITIGTDDLHLNSAHARPMRYVHPSIAGELKWIDRIRNHRPAKPKVVFGDSVTNAVSGIVDRLAAHARVSYCLFNGIDSQIESTQPAGKFCRDCGFSAAGESSKNNQHGSTQAIITVAMSRI
jgi:hypothetical protein